MNEAVFPSVLLLVPLWPLFLAGAVTLGVTRPLALTLMPWAALPALAAVAMPDTELQLPGAMLGGMLVLDATGRVFLLLSSVLWLASGLLARARLRGAGPNAFAVLLLLAMAGGFGLVLANDALLFYAASTLAGYGLYGAFVHGADAAVLKAGKTLVVLLVLSDLLVFELLLILGLGVGAVDFVSLRQGFLGADNQGLMLGLLVVGFGIKTGLLGVHFWLPRIFATAGAALPPALVAFMLGAGLLGGLRLLPLGEIDAWVAGEVLRWWAWLTLAYAGFVGLLQTHPRSILAYAAIALGGLWLGVLSACLQQPQLWQAAADTLAIVLIQSEFALAAMLLIDKANESEQSLSHGYLISGLNWLAALLLATAPLGMAEVMADRVAEMPIHWAIPVIAFLAANSLLRRDKGAVAMPEGKNSLSGTGQTWRLNMHGSIQVMMSASLTTLSAFAFVFKLVEASFGEIALAALILLASLLVAVLSTKFIATRLPALPPGDVLVSISHGLVLARNHAHRLIGTSALRWPDLGQALVRRLWSRMARKNVTEQWGTALDRWPTALVLMLLVGLLVAWMAGQG